MDGGLGVFLGQRFVQDDAGFSTGESFIKFVESFAEVYGRVTLFVRVESGPGRESYSLDPRRFRVVPLPFFDQFRPVGLLRSLRESRRILRSELPRHGAVWVGGPHMVGLEVVRLCEELGVPCFAMIRQNLVEQTRHKHRGPLGAAAYVAASWIEKSFRDRARRHPTFAVGRAIYDAYGGGTGGDVHEVHVSLIRDSELPSRVDDRAQRRTYRLLWVGRLSREKGLPVLLRAMQGLGELEPSPTLTLVGEGPIRRELEGLAADLGLSERVRFAGYVPYGPALAGRYADADLFVLPSLSEGLPQVLLESMAAGLPCLATTAGGVGQFLEDGHDARLVLPGDEAALRAALLQLHGDPALRLRLAVAALAKVREHTLERERRKMIDVLRERLSFPPRVNPDDA